MVNLTKHMDFTQFLTRKFRESNSNDHLHTELVQTKLNMSTGIRSGLFGGHFSGSMNSGAGQRRCAVRQHSVNGVNVCCRSFGVH